MKGCMLCNPSPLLTMSLLHYSLELKFCFKREIKKGCAYTPQLMD